jgi:protein-tyrosine phosphatase
MENFAKRVNFRDLGGLKTAFPQIIKSRRLLRSAQPVGLSAEDVAVLKSHDLRLIIDFRTLPETETHPVDSIEGVTYRHIDIMGGNVAQAALPGYWMKFFTENPRETEAEFAKTYRDFAARPSSMRAYAEFIRACIAQTEGAILFHCAAGKDRTGFGAAIILKLLGVSDPEIFADYHRTKDYQEFVKIAHITRAKEHGFTDQQILEMEEIFGVKDAYLQAAFSAANEKFGDFEGYVKNGLGLSGGEIAQLKENFLE